VTRGAETTKTAKSRLRLPVLVFLATVASSSQVPSPAAETKSPDLNLIMQHLEDVQHQDPAQSRPYEVTREYKVFRGYDKQRIVPKRKDKYLLRGQIWVDASTFHIRRIEGVPAKSPSFWIKDIHITLQYAELKGMWVPVSFDAIATVRLLGQYTLAGLNVRATIPLFTEPK
jgi:hypothetical protein